MNARTDHEVLVSVAQLLEELLAVLRHIEAKLSPREHLNAYGVDEAYEAAMADRP